MSTTGGGRGTNQHAVTGREKTPASSSEDPGLPVPRAQVEAYWHQRAPEVVRWFTAQAW